MIIFRAEYYFFCTEYCLPSGILFLTQKTEIHKAKYYNDHEKLFSVYKK